MESPPEESSSPRSRKRSSRFEDDDEEGEETPAKRQAVDEESAAEDEEEDEAEEDSQPENSQGPSPSIRRAINKPNKPAEAGILKKVYMENFMCHQKFSVDLCRNVNFITGQNSGKSAILAAIQICLGAGARRTSRGSNLRDLVRRDAATNSVTHAKIRVTLYNEGSDGYDQETYGDTITVERTISLNGGFSGYKLFGDDGKEKSRNKKDLEAMLDHL